MSAPTPGFFDERKEWSRWKHEILRRYLPKFAGILGSRHAAIYHVDGFAGAGMYKGSPPVPGSPLIAAELADTIAASQNKSYELRCINVEPHPKYFAELCQATSAYNSPIVSNLQGTFKDDLAQILGLVGSHPTLFFLDPFGYKGMEWDAISQLASRAKSAKTELIISFMISKVDRDAGWLDSYDQPASKGFVQALNDLMGTDQWQSIVRANLPKDQRDEQLTSLYAGNLERAFRGIVGRYPVRTISGQLKYYVLHLTCSQRGCREMSDVIYRVENDYTAEKEREKERLESGRPKQLSLLDMIAGSSPPEDPFVTAVSELAEDIDRLGMLFQHMTFGAVQDRLAAQWFGKATERHFRTACKLLIRDGKIKREKETGIDEKTELWFA